MEEDVETLLHIISTNDSLEIPRGVFRRYLQDMVERNPASMIERYKEKVADERAKFKKLDLEYSPLSVSMFNAVVDLGHTINIKDLIAKVVSEKLADGDGLKVVEFSAKYGKLITGIRYTNEYGVVGDLDKPYVSADFLLKVKIGTKTTGATFSFYKTGKIKFSGGYIGNVDNFEEQPRKILNFFSEHYLQIPRTIPIVFNNFVSEFKIGYGVHTKLVHDAFSETALSKFNGLTVIAKYDTKRSKFLYITFSKGDEEKFAIVMADSGVVQIQGTTNLKYAFDTIKKFAVALKNNGMLVIKGASNTNLREPKPTKLARRFDNMPAPSITRRGTTCPIGRRPEPYGYTGKCTMSKCYIKPNPQGQPCCYSIPKSIAYSRKKVEDAYVKAGVKVPQNVRQLFGFGQGTNNRGTNVARNVPLNVRTYLNNKDGFKIDSRQCLRYSKVALVDIATRLKIMLPKKLTKPILCGLIKDKSGVPNVQNRVRSSVISGKNRNLRLGDRLCDTYPRTTLVKYARALGGSVTDDMNKKAICAMIQQLSAPRLQKLQANFNAKQAKNLKNRANKIEQQRLKNIANKEAKNQARKNALAKEAQEELAVKRAARNIKSRLSRNQVKEDLMGMLELNSVNNKNVDALMAVIKKALSNGTIKFSKTGFPMKSSVDKVKRKFGLAMLNRVPPNRVPNRSPPVARKKRAVTPPNNSNSNENLNYFMAGAR